MTNKEAIKELSVGYLGDSEKIREATRLAIKALSQEPCEDAVSRQAVNDLYDRYHPTLATCVYEFGEELKALPSVNPTREHGEWTERRLDEDTKFFMPRCSKCDAMMPYCHHTYRFNFCPNCGAKMESEG